jgi:hypothetical protein
MPRLASVRSLAAPAALAALAALPPPALHGALASAAGTLLETLPFALGAGFLARPRSRAWLEALSCGCGRSLPGALALPAFALCCLRFGLGAAVARAAMAALVLRCVRQPHAESEAPEPLGDIAWVALAGGVTSVLAGQAPPPGLGAPVPGLLAGALAGTLAPCATAGVALAGGAAVTLPWVAAGMLATAGIVRMPRRWIPRGPTPAERPLAGRWAYAALSTACAWAALRGGAALVSPRLAPLVAAGAILAAVRALQPAARAPRGGWIAALVVGAALVFGSPQPAYVATATTLGALYPGERIAFFGQAYASGSASIVQRFAITCCRADASPIALRTERRLPARDGTWLEARGTIVSTGAGYALRVTSARARAAPRDPFLYR